MSADLARETDGVHDAEMSAEILALYRSAWPDFDTDWGRDIARPTRVPGPVLAPSGDPMATSTRPGRPPSGWGRGSRSWKG
jgi:hypothetical protein